MIELFIVILALAAIGDLTRRRGGKAWLTVPIAAVGYFVVGGIAAALVGQGPHMVAQLIWLVLCYAGVFLLFGGGKRRSSTWQCPECHFYNEPSTLVCPCGHRADAEPVTGA